MKNKLNDLPSIMEKGVYNGQRFSEESKDIVRNRIKKRSSFLLPNFLTMVAVCAFLGLVTIFIAKEFQPGSIHQSNGLPTESSLDLNGDLRPDRPLKINDDLIQSLSLPLEIQSVVPSASSEPIISAKTTAEGYSVSLTFPCDGFEVNMIENVMPSESIEKLKETRTQIGADEKTAKINGLDAYYSVAHKEMQVFMREKYITIRGAAEEDQLLVLAMMIDHMKTVEEFELKE